MKKIITFMSLLFMLLPVSVSVSAQGYSGERFFDGEHKNEISGYMTVGGNVVTGAFGGLSGSYVRHFTPRWFLGGDAQMQFGKKLFSIDATGGYRLPVKYGNIYFTGQIMYNYYGKFGFHEQAYNISATWESAYVDIRIGESIIHYHSHVWGSGWGYTEPLTLTMGFGVNIRHRRNPWNIGLFIRNYDQFYYENWNINWGVRWHARVKPQWTLFGEFNVRPAGSLSQLASRYETSLKIGLTYKM